MDQINNLIKKYNIELLTVNNDQISCALGIGDLLRLISCIKYNIINELIYINLACFVKNYNNITNSVEFRFKLIKNLIENNNIYNSIIYFYNENNTYQKRFVEQIDYSKITNMKLNINTENININKECKEEYIIFHTKARFHFYKNQVIEDLKIFDQFINSFKSKYKIYILGEKDINMNNYEINNSPDIITQLYPILINLSNNNEIIDKTQDCFIDNLNYNNFIEDIDLIKNAKYNIHFGDGGSMNMSLIFGKYNTIVYNKDMDDWDKNSLQNENSYIYNNIDGFLNKIKKELSNGIENIKQEILLTKKNDELNRISRKIKINNSSFFLCHGGLGDLIMMSGAINYISNFYNKIYLFCPENTVKNIKILFNNKNIEFLTYERWYDIKNENETEFKWNAIAANWYIEVMKYLPIIKNSNKKEDYNIFDWEKYVKTYSDLSSINNKEDAWHHWTSSGQNEGREFFKNKEYEYIDADIFISGNVFTHLDYFESIKDRNKDYDSLFTNKITNHEFINYKDHNIIKYPEPYYHNIIEFYSQLNFDINIYYKYFNVPSTLQSQNLFNKISNYKIVFLHFISSCGQTEIPENEWPHIYNDEYLIINPDKNHYNLLNNQVKYKLANEYLNLLLMDYIDIINNASDIYVCDSSFANIIFPLRIKKQLKANKVIIYDRFYPHSFHAFEKPIIL
jgi:hypothetical protein